MKIRCMAPGDWPEVARIYAAGMTPAATFNAVAPRWEDWNAGHFPEGRLVCEGETGPTGFCALGVSFPSPAAYRGLAEVSLYVDPGCHRQGIGRALLGALEGAARAGGDHALLSKIFADNLPSLRLHEACGYRRVGLLEKAGQDSAGRWRDVVLMEKVL